MEVDNLKGIIALCVFMIVGMFFLWVNSNNEKQKTIDNLINEVEWYKMCLKNSQESVEVMNTMAEGAYEYFYSGDFNGGVSVLQDFNRIITDVDCDY